MARRDFTVNAMAIRLTDGVLVDPFGGLGDLGRRRLRTVARGSFAEDPLRLVRALRFVSQLGLEPTGETLTQMRLEAGGLDHVSAERVGGGLAADGMGELSKLLLGRAPARALRLARDTGVLVHLIPEFAPSIGYDLDSERQPMALDEHVFHVVQAAADAEAPLAVRLAALVHDLGKPLEEAGAGSHAEVSARIARRVTGRLRYPVRMQQRVVQIVRHHAFRLDGPVDGLGARRFLAAHGDELAFDLVTHKECDLAAKTIPADEAQAVATLRRELEHERESAHRLSDLAVGGDDLRELGFAEGPGLGRVLRLLLAAVVDDPARNERVWLLDRAARELE